MGARAIAISSIRRRAGSSAGSGFWTMWDECACRRATTGVDDGCADPGRSCLRTRRGGVLVCARRHCRLDGAAQAASPEILLRRDRRATVLGYNCHAGRMLGRGAALIIGVDLVKDAGILNAAYNDAAGLTAKFNLNLLARINRELNGDFELENFGHRAFYNRERHRIEMHLVSKKRQKVTVARRTVEFPTRQTIHP